jgi:hypothetical protein
MKDTDVKSYIYNMYASMLNSFYKLNPNYNLSSDNIPQSIYRSHELPIAEHLMSFRQGLIDDFLRGFNSLEDAVKQQTRPLLQKKDERPAYHLPTPDPENVRFNDHATELMRYYETDNESVAYPGGLQAVELKYHTLDNSFKWNADDDYARSRFPTAYNLVQAYGDDIQVANYSIMGPNTVFTRHTDPEHRDGSTLRIHIPLIVPQGDLFMEVDGEEVDWSDIFGFHNQHIHSAFNLTNQYRLIFLIDMKTSRIGIPHGQCLQPDRVLAQMAQDYVPPRVREWLSKRKKD